MGKDVGAKVILDTVPLKYQGLTPREIWISESQERMILAVPQEHVATVITYFTEESVDATVIGEFTNDRRLRLYYKDKKVCDLDMEFLHEGVPMPLKKARAKKKPQPVGTIPKPIDFNSILLALIGGLNSSSREWVIREYDHEVQGASVIKPLIGTAGIGPQDAVVIKPRLDHKKGIVVSCGINPGYGRLDAYNMALSVIDEALRNLVAAGGDITTAAMLDNFCFSSPEREEVLADIVLSSRGCYDAAKAFGVPFISGKDSLNNEWSDAEGRSHLIPPTLLISALSVVDDVGMCITSDFKQPESLVYLIGDTKEELGGSEYFKLLDIHGGVVPSLDFKQAPEIMRRVHTATKQGLLSSCHDLSEGGLGLALGEMALSSDIGVEINVQDIAYTGEHKRFDFLLFSESNTRFIVEVKEDNVQAFETLFNGLPVAKLGKTTKDSKLKIDHGQKNLVNLPLSVLRAKFLRKIV
jgi:phosphoribosylformylglycinamidine synthase